MLLSRSSGEMKFDISSYMLKPVYFAFVKTMLEFFLQTTHFVKSRAHSPRPTSKIIAMIALRRAILMKANPVVSLHAHRLFSGRACSCKKDPCFKEGYFSREYYCRLWRIYKNLYTGWKFEMQHYFLRHSTGKFPGENRILCPSSSNLFLVNGNDLCK